MWGFEKRRILFVLFKLGVLGRNVKEGPGLVPSCPLWAMVINTTFYRLAGLVMSYGLEVKAHFQVDQEQCGFDQMGFVFPDFLSGFWFLPMPTSGAGYGFFDGHGGSCMPQGR